MTSTVHGTDASVAIRRRDKKQKSQEVQQILNPFLFLNLEVIHELLFEDQYFGDINKPSKQGSK